MELNATLNNQTTCHHYLLTNKPFLLTYTEQIHKVQHKPVQKLQYHDFSLIQVNQEHN
jgi:hypothetical protein